MLDPKRLVCLNEFLKESCADRDEAQEIVNLIEFQAFDDHRPLLQIKKEIAYLLAQELPDNTLLEFVSQYASVRLEKPTNESAASWLKWLSEQIDRELQGNLVPSPPLRVKLVRIVAPANQQYPHDLLLYPSADPLPEYWCVIWGRDAQYQQFLREWDGKTCPACQTPTIRKNYEKNTKAKPTTRLIAHGYITTNSLCIAVFIASWAGPKQMDRKPLSIRIIHENLRRLAKSIDRPQRRAQRLPLSNRNKVRTMKKCRKVMQKRY